MKAFLQKLWRITKRLVIWFFVLSIASTVLFRFVPVPVTPLMLERCLEQVFDSGKKVKLYKDWVSSEKMSASIKLAVIAAEDQNFEDHFGFDLEAIQKAQAYNERHKGKRVKGASTISQQTAKNVYLWPSRSWIRKGFEVYFTFLIEVFWSKERILEVYLNVIEMGDGIYGVEAASQEFFHKPASKLSVREAALIASVLPNPRKWSPARPSSYIQRRQQRIVRAMSKLPEVDL
jgi:monofunctional biosynthetic peptidoglycan transglycosylase